MKILFVSERDNCRTAIAKGLAGQVFGSQVTIDTAGTKPEPLQSMAVAVMREINIDVSNHTASMLDLETIESYDLLVLITPKNPFSGTKLKTQFLHWPLPDPHDPPARDEEVLERVKDMRVALSKHVKALGKQLEMRLRGQAR